MRLGACSSGPSAGTFPPHTYTAYSLFPTPPLPPPHPTPHMQEDRVVGGLFFQAEVRDRMARILDFFLKYLTGGLAVLGGNC